MCCARCGPRVVELQMTGFCLQQAEAFRRIDRAKASLLDLVECGNLKNKHSPPM